MSFRKIAEFINVIGYLTNPCGTTVKSISEAIDVNERYAQRIIDSIQDDFKFHLDQEKTETGGIRYRILPNKNHYKKISDLKLPDITLSLQEIISLYFLQSQMSVYKGTDIEKYIKDAFKKLDAFLPQDFNDKIQKIKTLFTSPSVFPKDYSDKDEIIEKITSAVLQQKTCLINYNSFARNKVTSFRIDPLTLFERNGGIYVFVRATKFGDIRLIALERILSINVTDDSFEYPENFYPEEWLENSFGLSDDPVSVKIRFDRDQAKYIKERKWSKKQKIEDMPDGSVVLDLETSGWYYVKRWILSFGNKAELLEPEDKRLEINSIINSMVSIYSDR